MHTVYMFYLYSEYIDLIGNSSCLHDYLTDQENSKSICLYAITDNKKYAKIFQKTRNMEYFVKRTVNIYDEEWEDFVNETSELWMDNRTFSTILNIYGKWHRGWYHIIVPAFEKNRILVYSDLILSEYIQKIDMMLPNDISEILLHYDFPTIFNEHYRYLLDKLEFFFFLRDQFPKEEELPFLPNIELNVVALYLDIYGQLYTNGGFVKLCKYGDFTSTVGK